MSPLPKLLFVVNVDWFFHSHRFPIALQALSEGFEVHIATTFTKPSYKKLFEDSGLIVHPLNFDRSANNILVMFTTLRDLVLLFRRVRPDVLHLVTILPVLLGGIASRFSGVTNVVFAISGLGHAFIASSFISCLRLSLVKLIYWFSLSVSNRYVVFQNTRDQNIIVRLCGLSSTEYCLISGSGVDLNLYSPVPLPTGTPKVLMASRLLASKGVYEFYEAAKILSSRGVLVDFQLAGATDPSNPLSLSSDTINAWRDECLINVLGFRTDIRQLISDSHIVCLPSYYPEGLPKVLCEAAACGRVVITTDQPGCRDAVNENISGLCIPSRDALALADAIEYLVGNFSLIESMGQSAREFAQSNFDLRTIVNRHLEIYQLLLSN